MRCPACNGKCGNAFLGAYSATCRKCGHGFTLIRDGQAVVWDHGVRRTVTATVSDGSDEPGVPLPHL